MHASRSRTLSARVRGQRLVAAVAAGGLAATLTACGGGTSASGASGSCPTADKELKLAFVYASTSLNPFQEMALGAKAAAKEDGNVDLTLSAPPKSDGPKQVALFQAAARTSVDGIALQTVTPELFRRPLNEASEDDIPLVSVDAAPPKGTDVKLFVGNSNTELGVKLGKALVAEEPDPNGTVVLGNDIPALELLRQRLNGVQQAIENELPNMTIKGPFNTKNSPTENYNAWKNLVQRFPDATAFIGVGGADGINLPLIQKRTGNEFLAGSADLPPQALKAVKNDYLFALSSPEHWMKGYVAMRLLIESKRECKPLPTGWWNSGSLIIDDSNIEEIIARQKSPQARTEWFQDAIAEQFADPPIKPLDQAD